MLLQQKVGVNQLEGVNLLEGVKQSMMMVNQGVGKGLGHRSRWVVASLHQDTIAFVFDAYMLLYYNIYDICNVLMVVFMSNLNGW